MSETWTVQAIEVARRNVEFWARAEMKAASTDAFAVYRMRRNATERTLSRLVRRNMHTISSATHERAAS